MPNALPVEIGEKTNSHVDLAANLPTNRYRALLPVISVLTVWRTMYMSSDQLACFR